MTLMVKLSTIGVVVKKVLDIFTVLVTSSGGLGTGVTEIRTINKYIYIYNRRRNGKRVKAGYPIQHDPNFPNKILHAKILAIS